MSTARRNAATVIGRRETLRLAPKRIVWEQLVQNQLWHADIAAYINSKALEGTHHIPSAFNYTQIIACSQNHTAVRVFGNPSRSRRASIACRRMRPRAPKSGSRQRGQCINRRENG